MDWIEALKEKGYLRSGKTGLGGLGVIYAYAKKVF